MDARALEPLIVRYKADPDSVYNTWFVSSETRLKSFRSIRRGVRDVAEAIAAGRFGNDFKGSPLEFVLAAITEQKEVFEGAAHPFYWKPKLRIPDIYENETNKRAFGECLEACSTATGEDQVLVQMSRLAEARIKGLGPAVANILYFLHPTVVPPFNTAMVRGFNALFGQDKKLGSWDSYLEMRAVIVSANDAAKGLLSKDLGAFAGFLYEIGRGRLPVHPEAPSRLDGGRAAAEGDARRRRERLMAASREEGDHTRIQHLLLRLGRELGCDVHVARNDRHRECGGESFAHLALPGLPESCVPPEVRDTVELIDVLWLRKVSGEVVCAFEVEKSTSIYSGMLRLQDLARSLPACPCSLYLVAPDEREKEVMTQFARPSFRGSSVPFSYLSFGDLERDRGALARLGDGPGVLQKLARRAARP